LTGTPGIECRSGGPSGNFQMAFTFANPLTSVGGATMTGTGSISNRSLAADPRQYIVDLTGVTNAQTISVTLTNVVDSTGNIGSVTGTMGVLLGDTTGNGAVNSSDIAQTQQESGKTLTNTNLREDVTANGAINSSDIATVQAQSGTALPAGGSSTNPTVTASPAAPANPKNKRAPRSKPVNRKAQGS
jgi:hypothetical protein